MSKFYVYGLIDPRSSSIFYIGKGKGKRVFQHEREKEDVHSNTGKLKTIREIINQGLELKHLIIADNLSEECALILEKILIYRLGRSIFNEGKLTNIVPGGHWNKNMTLFLKNDDLNFSNELIKYPELKPILEKYPHVAKKFTGLSCPIDPDDENIYVYDEQGEKIYTWTVDDLIEVFGLGKSLELINTLKLTNLPVYAWHRAWCKSNLDSFKSISQFPFQEFDILNQDFIEETNNCLKKSKSGTWRCYYNNKITQSELEITQNPTILKLKTYYLNGQIKHSTESLNNQLNNVSLSWHSNGQLKEEIHYSHNKIIKSTRFYENGNKELFTNHGDGRTLLFMMWYENGQLRTKKNHESGDSINYSESGVVTSRGKRIGKTDEDGTILTEYDDNGNIKKESKRYYINGLLHGFEKSYYNTGEIRRYVDYTKGYENKIITTYKKNGEISKQVKNST